MQDQSVAMGLSSRNTCNQHTPLDDGRDLRDSYWKELLKETEVMFSAKPNTSAAKVLQGIAQKCQLDEISPTRWHGTTGKHGNNRDSLVVAVTLDPVDDVAAHHIHLQDVVGSPKWSPVPSKVHANTATLLIGSNAVEYRLRSIVNNLVAIWLFNRDCDTPEIAPYGKKRSAPGLNKYGSLHKLL